MATRPYRKYSPAIAEQFIRPLYLLGKRRGVRMTALASAAVQEYLTRHAPDILAATGVPRTASLILVPSTATLSSAHLIGRPGIAA
jgi:hypothetical protein